MMTHDTEFDYETDIPAGYYDEIYKTGRGVRFMWHANKFEAVQNRLPSTAKTILDIGCGPGTFIGNYLTDKDATGVDLSLAQIEYARSQYNSENISFQNVSAQELVAVEAGFDCVTCLELIEHIENQDVSELFKTAFLALKPGGKAVFTTPNYRSLWPVIELGLNAVSSVSYEDQHINKYSKKRLKQQMTSNGFENVRVTTAIGLSPFFAVMGEGISRGMGAMERSVRHFGIGNILVAEGWKPDNDKGAQQSNV